MSWGARPEPGSDEDDTVRQTGGYPPTLVWVVAGGAAGLAVACATVWAVDAGVFDQPVSRAAGYSDGLRGLDCAEQARTGAPYLRWDGLQLRGWVHGCEQAHRDHPGTAGPVGAPN